MLEVKGNALAKAAAPTLQPLPWPAVFSWASPPRDAPPAFVSDILPRSLSANFFAITVLS
jgi:hypothetical protein